LPAADGGPATRGRGTTGRAPAPTPGGGMTASQSRSRSVTAPVVTITSEVEASWLGAVVVGLRSESAGAGVSWSAIRGDRWTCAGADTSTWQDAPGPRPITPYPIASGHA
jgi:hypothetical protein